MPDNRQRGPQRIETDLRQVTQVDQGVSGGLVDTGGAQVLAFNAQSFKGLGDEIGRLADHAAAKEGAAAGRLAGIDPEFRPSHALTIRGEAADAAGLSVYKTKTQQEISADFQQAVLQHGHSPQKLAEIFEAKARGWQSKILPEAWPELSIALQGERLSGMREASRHALAAQHADQQAAVMAQTQQTMADVTRQARTLGLDATADAHLEMARSAYAKSLDRTDAAGRRLVGPLQKLELLKHFDGQVLDSRLFGAYDRLPDLAAKKEYIAEFKRSFEAGTGLAKSLDNNQFTRSYHQLEAQYRHDVTAGRVELGTLATRVNDALHEAEKGRRLPDGQMAALRAQVAAQGATPAGREEKVSERFAEVETLLDLHQITNSWTPQMLDEAIRDERSRQRADGNTRLAGKRVDLMEAKLKTMRAELKADQLGYADRVGLIKVPPLDFTRADLVGQLQHRMVLADEVHKYFGKPDGDQVGDAGGVPPQFIRPDERAILATAIAQGGAPALAIATAITKAAGERAPDVMKELFEHSKTVAVVANLVVQSGEVTPAARDAMDGFGLRKAMGRDFKPLAPGPEKSRPLVVDELGTALKDFEKSEVAMVAAADAIFEVRARKHGLTTFEPELWAEGLREVLGQRTVKGETYGGVVKRGWFSGGADLLIPPAVKRSGFRDVIDMIKPSDIGATGHGQPVGADNKPLPWSRIKAGTLVQAGDGEYTIALGSPGTPGAEQFVGDPKQPDGKWRLNLKAMIPLLRSRRSDLFLPER